MRFTLYYILSALAIPACVVPVKVPLYDVYELPFEGSSLTLRDNPVRDFELVTTWKHESGDLEYRIYGFWDGDGKGGSGGNVFKVRFTPTQTGRWSLIEVSSNDPGLDGQHEGLTLRCTASDHPGFWIPDPESIGKRWYMRSNGEHLYILGNTLYSYVSETYINGPNGSDIERDTRECGKYFNKIRFAVTGDIYPHPEERPFLDESGNPTNDGNYSHRPNPSWFFNRVDLAVRTSYETDVIADLILNGPDSRDARSALRPQQNSQDPEPYLRYIAARYGSFPNIWFCLSNEFDVRVPKYDAEEIREAGHTLLEYLPYNVPLSVHIMHGDWYESLNEPGDPWNDHVIFQNKIKQIHTSADKAELNYLKGGSIMPVINDELAYEGEGDGWVEEDVLEAFTGILLGGGYGSTGYKSGHKLGQYFAGNFNAEEHSASDNLLWLRDWIDSNLTFWEMEPLTNFFPRGNGIWLDIYQNVEDDYRLLGNEGREYLLGASGPEEGITAHLPEGEWEVRIIDVVNMQETVVDERVSVKYMFDIPASRAVLVHFKNMD